VVKQSLNMRYENADLIEALTAEKTAAEAARQEAEQANRRNRSFSPPPATILRQPLHALAVRRRLGCQDSLSGKCRHIVNNISASIHALEACSTNCWMCPSWTPGNPACSFQLRGEAPAGADADRLWQPGRTARC